MFRIKPTRNQTTAKHVNLSPHPNNNLILASKIGINKNEEKKGLGNEGKREVPIPENKKSVKILKPDSINNQLNSKLSHNISPQISQVKQHVLKRPMKQIVNPQKLTKLTADTTKVTLHTKTNLHNINKPHERTLLKKTTNQEQHKLKFPQTIKKKTQVNFAHSGLIQNKKILNSNIDRKGLIVAKNQEEEIRTLKLEDKRQFSKHQSFEKPKINQNIHQRLNEKQINKIEEKPQQKRFEQKIQQGKTHKILNADNQKKKQQQSEENSQQLNHEQVRVSQPIIQAYQQQASKNQPTALEKQKNAQEQQQEKQRQLQQITLKIQLRRQARQKQRRRLQQIEEKRKQQEERALQFMNQRNGNSEGLGAMIKLNDQLMHFSLAQSIMDLQIKKLLKTNFDQFPNSSQIKYQVEELQRINQSYEMVRIEEQNPLKKGLENYRVQIFNRIGQLIVQAQQQGYSNPNFHIIEHDGRLNSGPNSVIPSATKGLPEESHGEFIKYAKNYAVEECTICLVEITIGETMAKLQCGHKFHSECIKEWVQSSANCPTCRFNIKFGNK